MKALWLGSLFAAPPGTGATPAAPDGYWRGLERHLSPHRKCIELRARVAEVGGAHLLGNVAVKVVEHEADIAIDVSVQRQRIDRLPPAGDAGHGAEPIAGAKEAGVFDRANCHEARLPIRYSLQDREQPTTGP
jgi:hypothetical protein